MGTASLSEIEVLSDKEDYIGLSVQGSVDVPVGWRSKIKTKIKSGKVSFIQIRGTDFAKENCDISYCLGYFYFKGSELWIDIDTKDKNVISYQIGFMDDNGDVNFLPIEGLKTNWTQDKYSVLERMAGAQDSEYPSINFPATSLTK